jgi:hypothetical protein
LHLFRWNGARGAFVHGLQHLHRAGGFGFVAVDFELLVAVRDFDVQGQFDGAQMFVGRAAQMRQTGVVVRDEGVAKNQVDNLSKGTQ